MSRNDTAPNRGNDGQHSETTTSDGEPAEAFIATEITAVSADLNITTETVDGNVSVMITGGGDGGNTVSRLFLEPDRTRQESPGDSLTAHTVLYYSGCCCCMGNGAPACGLRHTTTKVPQRRAGRYSKREGTDTPGYHQEHSAGSLCVLYYILYCGNLWWRPVASPAGD